MIQPTSCSNLLHWTHRLPPKTENMLAAVEQTSLTPNFQENIVWSKTHVACIFKSEIRHKYRCNGKVF